MIRLLLSCSLALLAGLGNASQSDLVRIKDLGRVEGWRDNALVGYGLVTGLAGSGDSARSKAASQSLANVLSQFDVNLTSEQIASRNVAAVMITSTLPPFARQGDKLDLIVTSIGDARSLVGGTLLLAPLKGPDGRIYALAQGPISVGGYKYDANGNLVQKNHPTVGSIPSGATVETVVPTTIVQQNQVQFILAEPDYTSAHRVAQAINAHFRDQIAEPSDASAITVRLDPARRRNLVSFLTEIENLSIQPDQKARVVINERTGTVIAGGGVRISNVSISYGDMKVSINTEYAVSQPLFVTRTTPGVRTVVVPSTRIEVDESRDGVMIAGGNNSVSELVRTLTKVKTSTRDIIAILQGIKAAGALHAELIIQ